MLATNAILTISWALGASAFLLPPGASPATKNSLIPLSELDTKTHLLPLPCASCSLDTAKTEAEDSEDRFSIAQYKAPAVNILLNFSISENGKALLLNNEQIYPVSYNVEDLLKPDWYVQQVGSSVLQDKLVAGDFESTPARITGHMLGQADGLPATPNGDELLSVSWKLLSLDHEMADVDEVLIQMIRTPEDELLLLAVDRAPDSVISDILFPTPALRPVEIRPIPHGHKQLEPPHKNCKNLPGPLCSIVDFIDNKVNSFKAGKPGCGGMRPKFNAFDGHMPGHIRPHFGPHGKDGKFGPPRPHHHHRHSVFHKVSKAVLAVLVPAMAGITVGMLVSVLGLLTGRFIGWLWFTVIRGGKKGNYTRLSADDIVIVVTDADKKEAYVDEEQAEHLPRYEDAPAYEETEKEVL